MEEIRSSYPLSKVIATLLGVLALPLLYVGSYFALVLPGHYAVSFEDSGTYVWGYRYFGDWDGESKMSRIAPTVFWPLEQIDRQLRPDAWNEGSEER